MKVWFLGAGVAAVLGMGVLNVSIFSFQPNLEPVKFAETTDDIVVGAVVKKPQFKTEGILKEVLARPLFMKTRRPFEKTAEIVSPDPELELIEEVPIESPKPVVIPKQEQVVPEPVVIAAKQDLPPDLKLHGLLFDEPVRKALLSSGESLEPKWYLDDAKIDGWLLKIVNPNQIQISMGEESIELQMYVESGVIVGE